MAWLAGFDPVIFAPQSSAFWFLPFAAPISIYVIWSDLRAMRIPNVAVSLLFLGFVILGPFALPLPDYGWRLLHAAVLLAAGFVLFQFGSIGAGDVKFIAAAAPLVAGRDVELVLLILSAALLGGLAGHRAVRAIPAARGLAPGWVSWTRKGYFPMGASLGLTVLVYLLLVAGWGR